MNFNSNVRKNNKKIDEESRYLNREFWLFKMSKRPLITDGFFLVLDNNEFWYASRLNILMNDVVINRMPNVSFLSSIDLGASLGQMRSSEGLKITSKDITNKYGVSPLGTYFGSISDNSDIIKREFPEYFI